MRQLIYPVLGVIMFGIFGCKSTQVATTKIEKKPCNSDTVRMAFYNVENLFDLVDNPKIEGEDQFLPGGEKDWTRERLNKKLADLSKVIAALGNGTSAPAVLGLCEVENSSVLEELLDNDVFSKGNFKYLHKDSPDKRGIDVCLAYNADIVSVLDWEALKIKFPKEPDYTSRDIVYAHLDIKQSDKIHLFVNHWPSRYNGKEISEPRRMQAALTINEKVETILTKNPNAKIVLMGDFNDEPTDRSIKEVLNTTIDKSNLENAKFLNAFHHLVNDDKKGSYNYKGEWNFLDQIIISKNLYNNKDGYSSNGEAGVLYKKWMLYNSKYDGLKPNRTFGRDYYGGFSDHLPVYIDLVCE